MQGAARAISSIAVLITFIPMRWRFVKGRGGWNSTLAFSNCTYIYFIVEGVSYLFFGSWRIAILPHPAEAPAILALGVVSIGPFLGVLLYGRQKLFQVMARWFEDKRRKFDSAVIAQLMDNTEIRVGQDWWIHHGNNLADEFPGTFDHRRNWTRGIIVRVEGGRYAVDVAVEQLPLDIGKRHGRRRRSSCPALAHSVGPEPTTLVWIALPGSAKLKAEELLKNAMDNLRLVDGQYVTHDLMMAKYVDCHDDNRRYELSDSSLVVVGSPYSLSIDYDRHLICVLVFVCIPPPSPRPTQQ